MPIARTSILRGPCKVTFNGATFFAKDGVTLELGLETFELPVDAHGIVDERVLERVTKVRFTPSGEWENLTVLWPHGSTLIGTSMFTGSDLPLVIQTIGAVAASTTTLTFKAAAVTKMPQIILKSSSTMIGEVEFTCIGADNQAWTTADNLFAVSTAAYSDTTFDPSVIKTEPYTLAWGSSPWNSFSSLDGVVVDFNMSTSPVTTDAEGIVDMMFTNLQVTATLTPVGITEAQIKTAMRLDGASNVRGRSLNANSADLVCTGVITTANIITIKNAQMKAAPMVWNSTVPRIGAVQFVATRGFSAGVRAALFTVAP
jgi:hypothetical protein